MIKGVQQACQKPAVQIVHPQKAVCRSCNLLQLLSTYTVSWSLCLLIRPHRSEKNLSLKLDNNMTEFLLNLLGNSFVLAMSTEEDIIMLILESSDDKSLMFTYNPDNNQVTEISIS